MKIERTILPQQFYSRRSLGQSLRDARGLQSDQAVDLDPEHDQKEEQHQTFNQQQKPGYEVPVPPAAQPVDGLKDGGLDIVV